jgi:hypothetical protein
VGLAIDQSQPAQAFALTGGSSSSFDTHGASIQVLTPDYRAGLILAILTDRASVFSLLHLYRGALLNAGDQQIPLVFPTEIFDQCIFLGGA